MESSECSSVQIQADLKEIRRRIAAFQTRKRREIDDLNLQEFCSRRDRPADCCRTDAVVVRRTDSRGHIKVSRVRNQWGPQMMGLTRAPTTTARQNSISTSNLATTSSASNAVQELPDAIEERIHNMEAHLRLTSGKPVPRDIYARLKTLEDRILFLESISPDYFVDRSPPRKVLKVTTTGPVVESAMSLGDIEVRIKTLRDSLLHHRETTTSQ